MKFSYTLGSQYAHFQRPALLIALIIGITSLAAPALAQQNFPRMVATDGIDMNNDCRILFPGDRPCLTIQHAIDVAESGDTVEIYEGVYTQPLLIDGKNLSFVRATGVTSHPVIEAAEQPGTASARAVGIVGPATVSFNGVTIRHGNESQSDGGGIYCINGCILNLRNVIVMANSASGEGGGIFIHGSIGTSTFTNVVIKNNEADSQGGGIRVVNSDLTLENNVRVRSNEAGGFGGGISMTGGSGVFTDVLIGGQQVGQGNTAASSGGGVRVVDASLSIADSYIGENESGATGGGVSASNCVCQLVDTYFVTNHADDSGGGLYYNTARPDDSVFLTRVDFILNSANANGGGMVALGRAYLTDVRFDLNKAGLNGGGLWNSHNATALDGVVFSGNQAGPTVDEISSGGGMHNVDSSPTLRNVMFDGNRVTSSSGSFPPGGGLSVFEGSPSLENVAFIGNTAFSPTSFAFGGGMYINEGSPTLTNVIFDSNVASSDADDRSGGGGGIFARNSSPTLLNVTITGNTAEGGDGYSRGGGIMVDLSSSLVLVNSVVWGNTADHGNEIDVYGGSSAVLQYSLYDNAPGDIGGDGELDVDDHSIIANPLFVDAENGDLRLQELSPAVDAGHPDSESFGYPVNGSNEPIDLDLNPRFFGSRVDMGPYEFNPTIADEASPQEVAEVLSAPHPNPVRTSTTLTVAVAQAQDVTVEVFDALGRRVQTLYDGALAAGTAETLTLDASALPAGVYIIRAVGEGFAGTRRLTVVR